MDTIRCSAQLVTRVAESSLRLPSTAQGGREGDRIVLRGSDSDGLPIRWTFREIMPQSFHWTGEKSHDGGNTWVLEEDHHMKRRAG